jgi:hypothetical protein
MLTLPKRREGVDISVVVRLTKFYELNVCPVYFGRIVSFPHNCDPDDLPLQSSTIRHPIPSPHC